MRGRLQLVELVHPSSRTRGLHALSVPRAESGEADMYRTIHSGRFAVEAGPLGDPAEIDPAHQDVVLAIGLNHFRRDS